MRYLLCLMGLVILTACDSHPSRLETATTPIAADTAAMRGDSVVEPVAQPPVWWVPRPAGAFRRVETASNGEHRWERVRPTPAQVVSKSDRSYRRYRGTLGGQLVTVGLEITDKPDTLGGLSSSGRYYPDYGGKARMLQTPEKLSKTALFQLHETRNYGDTARIATWYATQPLGPMLTGQRRDQRTGQVQLFQLREDYTGAVRYEIVSEEIRADTLWRDFGDGEIIFHDCNVSMEVLHLLGPDTLRSNLRRLQCPTPKRRRAALADELSHFLSDRVEEFNATGEETCQQVEYNGSGILSVWTHGYMNLGPGAGGADEHCLYDLITGRPCAAADWLRADRKTLMWAYLIRQARQQPQYHGLRSVDWRKDWPRFGLDSDGLYCDLGEVTPLEDHQYGRLTIPYAALAPYVRPGTPLARLVAARTRPTPARHR